MARTGGDSKCRAAQGPPLRKLLHQRRNDAAPAAKARRAGETHSPSDARRGWEKCRAAQGPPLRKLLHQRRNDAAPAAKAKNSRRDQSPSDAWRGREVIRNGGRPKGRPYEPLHESSNDATPAAKAMSQHRRDKTRRADGRNSKVTSSWRNRSGCGRRRRWGLSPPRASGRRARRFRRCRGESTAYLRRIPL